MRGRRLPGLLAVLLVVVGCRSQSTPEQDAKRAFDTWNALAKSRDSKAGKLLCSGVELDESKQLIARDHPGFSRISGEVSVWVEGNLAEIDFRDGGDGKPFHEEDVFVGLVRQSGTWKVCGESSTAPGGFG
jgi:hypothetical protein